MPISEDEFNQYSNDSIPSTTMSKAELRKTHKPIMEKRRRAKINNCLNEIKQLILVAMKKDPERHSKLEKADILEMAVKHLKNVQRQQRDHAIRSDPAIAQKYKAGFAECADEVTAYVDQMEGIDAAMKQRLAAHLKKCSTTIDHKPQSFNSMFGGPFGPGSSLLAAFATNSRDDQNNNNNGSSGHGMNNARIELIPSCLPNGDFAFLVPKASFSTILNTHLNDERPSAFVTVTPSNHKTNAHSDKLLSPPISPLPSTYQPIQNIRYPIMRKEGNVSEPLCIITNNAERHRQAIVLPETCNNAENVNNINKPAMKRKLNEGLLTLAVNESAKRVKVEEAASSRRVDGGEEAPAKNDSMWRPW